MSKLRNLFNKEKKVEVKKEEPKQRSTSEIQQEYTDVCARIGNIDYQIWILENDKELLRQRGRELNHEGSASKQREALEAAQKAKEVENGPKA